MSREIWLIRHGETAWSLSGAHTGKTDIPLTAEGERRAALLITRLAGLDFDLVLTSPLQRAKDTARIAGFGESALADPDLVEWNYGDYEGLSTPEIRQTRPGWHLWDDGVPNGETVEQVGLRVARVIARAAAVQGNTLLFAHGHLLRILTAVYLGLPARDGRLFALGTAAVSVLGYERATPVILRWNT